MANINGYIPETQLLASAMMRAGDPGGGIVGQAFYRDFLASGLRNLCFEAEWDKRYHDIPFPEDRIVTDMPKYISGINSIWLYMGPMCDPQRLNGSVRVHIKDNYVHDGGLGGFQDNQWFNFPDGTQNSVGMFQPWNLFYAGYTNGKLYLSPQCSGYARIRIYYTGIGLSDYCPNEQMQVPIWAVDALECYVAMRASEVMIGLEGKTQEAMARWKIFNGEYKDIRGAWSNAKMYWSQADAQDRKDVVTIVTYLGYRQ